MDFKQDTAYVLYIKEDDRKKALNIIADGLEEYICVEWFRECIDNGDYFTDGEFCNSEKCITFCTFISNIDELLKLNVDGRGKGKVKIVFGVTDEDYTFFEADDILRTYQ